MLGRRVFTRIQFVLENDPAVAPPKKVKGKDVDSYQDYVSGGWDMSKLKLKGTPTIWTLRPLSYPERMHRDSITELRERVQWLLRCGIVDVKDYPLFKADGSYDVLPSPSFVTEGKSDLVAMEWLERANLLDDQELVLAQAVQSITEAEEGKS